MLNYSMALQDLLFLVARPTTAVLLGRHFFGFMIGVERMGLAQDFVKRAPTVAETTNETSKYETC